MVKIDTNLVFLVSENSRAKIKEMSSVLKKSSQRLKYSLNLLEKEGVIASPYCIFDYSYFGLILFRVYFKGGYISEKDKAEIIRKLGENPFVVSMYEMTGEYDIAIEISAPNPSRFNKELRKITSLIPTFTHYEIILNIVTHVYPRWYLAKNPGLGDSFKEIIVGGDREKKTFNEREMKLMKSILENPKIRLTSLAKKSSLNIKTAASLLKDLESRKIIKGFKYIIDTNKLGVSKSRLFMRLHNLGPEREAKLMEYMLSTKEIVQVNKTVGDWDMEVDIEALDKKRSRYLIMQLREEFKDIIETFNLIEFYNYYKRAYLPMNIFQEPESPAESKPKSMPDDILKK